MSNRKKPAEVQAQSFKPSMTVIPSIYCNQYEYSIDGGLIGLKFGRGGETHVDVTISLNLILDIANKVQDHVVKTVAANTEESKP